MEGHLQKCTHYKIIDENGEFLESILALNSQSAEFMFGLSMSLEKSRLMECSGPKVLAVPGIYRSSDPNVIKSLARELVR